MKKIVFSIMLACLMVSTVITSYGQEANKKPMKAMVGLQVAHRDSVSPKMELMKVRKDTINSKMEMEKTIKDSAAEFQRFEKEAELKFLSNRKNIAVLRGKYLKLDETDKACMERISKLEQKNNDLKKSLADYTDSGKYDWSSFKNRFNYDMDELQIALKEFTPEKMK